MTSIGRRLVGWFAGDQAADQDLSGCQCETEYLKRVTVRDLGRHGPARSQGLLAQLPPAIDSKRDRGPAQ